MPIGAKTGEKRKMLGILKKLTCGIFSQNNIGIHAPVMDGALKPNKDLDDLKKILDIPGVRNLCWNNGLWMSQGPKLINLMGAEQKQIRAFSSDISALATDGEKRWAVGLAEGKVLLFNDITSEPDIILDLNCPTALCFGDGGKLFIANGSKTNSVHNWQRDLLTGGKTGSVLVYDDRGIEKITENLKWPSGICPLSNGELLVSEAWEHRVFHLKMDGSKDNMLIELPAYPGRIYSDGSGNFWLTFFAPRNQLVEFHPARR